MTERIREAQAALSDWLQRDGLPNFDTHAAVVDAALRLYDERIEVCLIYWLSQDRRLIRVDEIARGAETEATVSVRHIAHRAILADAHYCISVHNHPSGLPDPSEADKSLVAKIDAALAAIGVLALGHHVVSKGGFADIRTGKILRADDVKVEPATQANLCPTCKQGWPHSQEPEKEHHHGTN